jgi:putative membrane protein
MTMMWGHDWGWGAWVGMSVLMLLFWALVITALVALVRSLSGSRRDGLPPASPDHGRPNAEQLLDERFACGEIDPDDYTRRRQLLRADR